MKEDINTYRMVKVPCRLMHWVTLFGPFLGPNLPKNRHFVNFLENGTYDFLKLGIRMEDISAYQMAGTAWKLVLFCRSYRPKGWG